MTEICSPHQHFAADVGHSSMRNFAADLVAILAACRVIAFFSPLPPPDCTRQLVPLAGGWSRARAVNSSAIIWHEHVQLARSSSLELDIRGRTYMSNGETNGELRPGEMYPVFCCSSSRRSSPEFSRKACKRFMFF